MRSTPRCGAAWSAPSSPTARPLARSSATAAPDRSPASRARDQTARAAGPALPATEAAGEAADVAKVCSQCGGPLVSGAFVLPILGRAKFAYNLRGRSIETDVDAQMCSDCGLLTFTAQDPGRIRRAHDADRYAEAAADGAFRRARRGTGAEQGP